MQDLTRDGDGRKPSRFEQGDFAGAARAYAAVAEQSDDLRMQTHGWFVPRRDAS